MPALPSDILLKITFTFYLFIYLHTDEKENILIKIHAVCLSSIPQSINKSGTVRKPPR